MITVAKNDPIDRLDVFNQYRSLLFAIAYRMLGSVTDAEDMVQDTFLRWQQASEQSIKSTQAYLTTIITRLCIDRLRSARVQREHYIGSWLPEPIVTESTTNSATDPMTVAELADSLTMAFLVLLERLSPLERAVFLLREAFGYDYNEIGQIVEKKAATCRQIFRRARQHLADQRPRFQTSLQQQEQLTYKFMQASQQGDVQGLLDLLAKDITLWSDGGGQVVACLKPLHGAAKVAGFLRAIYRRAQKLGWEYEVELAQINGQPGLVYTRDNTIETVVAIEIVDNRIQSLYFMRNPDKLKQSFSKAIAEMVSLR
ncbi:RNA polymerase sigma-70 factor [Leptolyngbyaceae cyanobacterium CCMR0082]|uniref:RNA polymerase sigma-70 factor n=1 Tax=Adonisia turfae CCMR0082 TaxID=2304604 RepID=A0A6M0S6W0_9CYAN|nr:RNA polymerase sigma-70 factor [Adonisia turfae]MDV3348767.1 RNA polymerase sigma-70 factor [Leptothoe sp. LEGE 181152]NEZ64136.1 RNA polymerase sigma-70 factor [Adonisia turfae CCMR0082]